MKVINPENLVYPVVGTSATAVAVFKALQQVRQPNLQRGFLISLLIAPGISYFIAAPAIYRRFDSMVGVPNLGTLVVYSGVVVFAFSAIGFLNCVIYPRELLFRRLRWWALGYAAAICAMTVLFLLAPVDVEAEGSTGFDSMYATSPWIPWFIATFNLAFGVGLLAIGPYCWRWSKQTERPWLRRGLRVIAIGSLIGLGYIIPKIIYILLRQTGTDVANLNTYAPAGAVGAALFYLAGFTLCAMGPVSDFRQRYTAYQAIHPLWKAVVAPFPSLLLPGTEGPSNPRLTLRPGRLKTLLYRRVVEVWDARLKLRPWFDSAVAEQAHVRATAAGLDGMDRDAMVEAALLQAAVGAYAVPSPPPRAVAQEAIFDTQSSWFERGDLVAESRWLSVVAQYYAVPAPQPRADETSHEGR